MSRGSPVLNPNPHGAFSWPTSKSPFTPFLPAASLLRSSKLLRESSASLLHLASQLPQPRGSLLAWLPRLGLNPSANLPLQPHFQFLPQSATPASIPVFFQLFWAVIISLGRCGLVAWSQSSPSSHVGTVTRGSCLPVISWVEVTSISLAQSMATAI